MIGNVQSILEEQRRCRDYILENKGEGVDGAWMGLEDWVKEELLELAEGKSEYAKFLGSKRIMAVSCGFEVNRADLNPMLFEFQKDIVVWAIRRGKAAVFAHTGMGKGPIQLEWCHQICKLTGRNALILAPLAVSQQFKREADKFNIPVTLCRNADDVRGGINITNYERFEKFTVDDFVAVAMDESSCIKDWTSKTTSGLIDRLRNTPYKLCSSATPSPNDHSELGTHAELLDVMSRTQMLSMFFEHDGGETSKWALKGHGKRPFWKFVATWAVCLKRPSDLGYSDDDFELPPLNLVEHVVDVDQSVSTDGMLFRSPDLSATGLHKEMRLTCESRAARVAELVREKPDVPWMIWCNTNYESDAIKKIIPGVVEIRGSDSPDKKEDGLNGFATGEFRMLLSKPEIAGFGMNYQHCCNMAFVGLSYSFENLFQAIRRCWRYGQTQTVNAHLVIAETEGKVLESIRRKEKKYEELQAEMNQAMREEQLKGRVRKSSYEHEKRMVLPKWL